VVVPAGYTLAAGVQLTPLPDLALGIETSVGPASAAATAAPVSDPAKWNTEAEKKCQDAVGKLAGKPTNPAGLAVCYNVPFLDQKRGVFEAELRIYNISTPTDPFLGVTPATMNVTLQYQGATIQKSDGTLPVKRSLVERQADGIMMPVGIAIRKYVGQVNKALMSPGMNLTLFQPLLVPQITISANSPTTRQLVNTSLSSTESSFVAGVFSAPAGSRQDPKFLLGLPAEQVAAAAAGIPTPFGVPGLSLGVFPTGLIITSVWVLLFSTVVGLGTIGRIQYREEFRRRVREQKSETVRRL